MRTPEFPDDAAEQPQDRQDLQPDGSPETAGEQAAGNAPDAQGAVTPERSRFAALRQAGEHLRAAWRDARPARPRRVWPRVYWQALVSHAGKRQAQRIALSALIVTLLLTGSGGLFLTTALFPHLFGPSVTRAPNTLDQFKNGGNAYGQTGSQTPTPHAPLPPGGGALTPAQAPSSSAPTVLQPVIIALDPSKHLNSGSQSSGAITRYLASDQVLEVGLADTSIDLTSATPSGAAIPVYTPAPKPTPPPAPKGPITQATPTPASAPHARRGSATSASWSRSGAPMAGMAK